MQLLRKLIRQAGIKKKAIITRRCCPNTSSKRVQKDRDGLLALAEKMEEYYRQERHILYIDECVFSARGYQESAWSAPNTNVRIEDRSGR